MIVSVTFLYVNNTETIVVLIISSTVGVTVTVPVLLEITFWPEMKIFLKGSIRFGLFFLSGFSFTNIHDLQDSKGRGEAISLTSLYHFLLLYRHFNISSPLHIANNWIRTRNLWFPSESCKPCARNAENEQEMILLEERADWDR